MLEKVVHTQLESHLEEGNLIDDHQYGFRHCSIIHAIYQLLNHINVKLNNRIPTVALFIDFRKALDCLQFPILLEKIQNLNLDADTVHWISNYLSNRSQYVKVNGTDSKIGNIKQGVSQGSILGPLLYTLYAKDIRKVIKKCKYAFYADDTVI